MRYLGVYIISSRKFTCDFTIASCSFNRAANAVLSKIGLNASEEVLVHLIKAKCIPILLYGCEAVGMLSRDLASMDFSFIRVIMKIFKCNNRHIIDEILSNFGIFKPSELIVKRTERFNVKYLASGNGVCQYLISLVH